MDMHEDEHWTAVARYLEGEGSPEEQAAVRAWLAADPGNQKLLDTVAAMKAPRPADLDVDAALRRTDQKIRDDQQSRPAVRPAWRQGLAIAAALAMIAVGAVAIRNAVRSPAAARNLTTTAGVTDSLVLADGTRVILGPGSQLIVPEGFDRTRREVSLIGEALFDVRRPDRGIFSVRTADMLVRDIGTTFAVRSDAAAGTRVVVTSGAVTVQSAFASAASDTVRAGQSATITGGRAAIATIDTTAALAWTRGRLVFDDTPLIEVAGDLRRWFGLEITLADSALARRRFTAAFRGESPESVLTVMAAALGVTIEQHGAAALIRP